ncbi:MAG: P-II family nitrogen regulator, partial [Candidatus Bathyarchaeia archaeon]
MKKVEAIIRPEKLSLVKTELEKIGCSGLTITEVSGYGKQGGIEQQWRGEKYKIDLIPKVKLEIVCKDEELDKICNTIVS